MGQARRIAFRLATILIGALACFGAVQAKNATLTFSHDGLDRVIWQVDGRTDKTQPSPLVLALHGFRSTERAAEIHRSPEKLSWDRLTNLAEQEGFIALYPAAYRGQWAIFTGLDNTEIEPGVPIDDEAFLLALIEDYITNGAADPAAIYITGISDGAIMTFRMICLEDQPFAAAATLIGTAFEPHLENCEPNSPPALMHVHGTEDPVLPYEGWIFPTGREVSVPEVMEHWRRLHMCTGQTGQRLEDIDPDDGSTVSVVTWTGCALSDPVVRYKITGGGHQVPSTERPQRADAERQFNRDLDTLGVMWDFFSEKTR